jgi:hypothetical protein
MRIAGSPAIGDAGGFHRGRSRITLKARPHEPGNLSAWAPTTVEALDVTMHPSKPTNHDIERHYFEQFRAAYELPPGTVCYGDKPDVLIKGDRTLGIEVTNFYRRSGDEIWSEQKQQQRRNDVLVEAQGRYRDIGGKEIVLTIGFSPDRPITSKRKKELPKELAKLAARIDALPSGALENDYFADIPEIDFIWLNSNEHKNANWRLSQVNSVELLPLDRLKSIVRQKEAKIGEYALCDDYWLLVVVDWNDPAQEQEIRVDNLEVASNVFEKIIIYKTKFDHVVEVKKAK